MNIILIICVLLLCISSLINVIGPVFMFQSGYEEIEVDNTIKDKLDLLAKE